MKKRKTNLTFALKIVLLSIFFTLTHSSCEKDEFIEMPQTNNINYNIQRLSFEKLKEDTEFNNVSYAFKLQEETTELLARKTTKKNDFEIDFSSAKKLTTKDGVSFTFLINRNKKKENTFENLVIEKNANGDITGYIVRYEGNEFWNELSSEPFKGKVSISPYADNLQQLIQKINKKYAFRNPAECGRIHFFSIFVEYSCTSAHHHGVGEGCECNGLECDPPHTEVYTFQSFVPCNDFSSPVGVGDVGDGSSGGGGSGGFGDSGGGNSGSGTAILGPNGINVPNREYLVNGVNATYANKTTYENYFHKSWQLFNFFETTNFVKYQKPQNKPIYKAFKDLTAQILNDKHSISENEFRVLYANQKFIIDILDRVNFDFSALPVAQQKEISKRATFNAIFHYTNSILAQYWPKNDEEWAVIGSLFEQFLPELALGFIPGSSIIDVVKGIDQGDTVAVAIGIAGVIVDAFGGTIFKGLSKVGRIAYKVFKSFKLTYKFVKVLGKALKTGLKVTLDGTTVILKKSGTEIARIANNILTFNYKGFGGKIITTPNKTTTVIGKWKNGTDDIINSGLSKSGKNTGGINALSEIPNPKWNDQQIWDNINEPWLKKAASRKDVIRAVSDPLKPSNVFKNLTNVPNSVFNNPNSLANYLKNLSDPNMLKNLSFYGREIKWLFENGYIFNPSNFKFIK